METGYILTFILLGLIPVLVVFAIFKFLFSRTHRNRSVEVDEKELSAAEEALKQKGEQDWVVLKRCHGPAYNHSAMAEIVSALAAGGVEATYDVISSSSADGGVTNYMLKVLRGSETRASEILASLEISE